MGPFHLQKKINASFDPQTEDLSKLLQQLLATKLENHPRHNANACRFNNVWTLECLNNNLIIEKYEYLNEEPLILNEYFKEYINLNNTTCKIISNEKIMLKCKGCYEIASHSHMCIEK